MENIDKLKERYAAMDAFILEDIIDTKLDTLDETEQTIAKEELEKRKTKQTETENTIALNQDKLKEYIEKMKLEQNLPMGFVAGLGAAILGAILWAVITVTTEYQIGFMAMAVGFMVGYAIRFFGKGIDQIFGIMGAILALFGCLLGNFLSVIGFIANAEGFEYLDLLMSIEWSLIPEIMIDTFNPMDILFYGFAIYEGYRFSFRQFTDEEIMQNATD